MRRLLVFTLLLSVSGCLCRSREEKLAAAEARGELMASEQARLAKGIGDSLDKEGTVAGESFAKGAARVIKSVGSGAETGFVALQVKVSDALGKQGLKAERASVASLDDKHNAVKVYLVLDKAFKGDLTLVLRDKDGKEAGRSKLPIDEPETGKYVLFDFDPLTDWVIVQSAELR